MSAAPMSRMQVAAAAAALILVAVAGTVATRPALGQAGGEDPLRAALAESSGKGLTSHVRGSQIGGAVGDKFVTVKNQQGIAVIPIDSIDAVAGAITLR